MNSPTQSNTLADLVKRLRDLAEQPWFTGGLVQMLSDEAADTIEAFALEEAARISTPTEDVLRVCEVTLRLDRERMAAKGMATAQNEEAHRLVLAALKDNQPAKSGTHCAPYSENASLKEPTKDRETAREALLQSREIIASYLEHEDAEYRSDDIREGKADHCIRASSASQRG